MHFQIITPERIVFADEVDQVSLTTSAGEITIMAHHIPLVTVLRPGELRYKKDGQEKVIAVSGGFAEVKANNSIVILADTAEHATEIDFVRAEAARDRALETMKSEVRADSQEYASIQASLEKELNRLKVGKKYRRLP